MTMTGTATIWIPDGIITAEELGEYGRPAIEQAAREGQGACIVKLPDGREVALYRFSFRLPVFIESEDWQDAQEFAAALSQRASRDKPN